jgi:Ca2+:H+ antiporter
MARIRLPSWTTAAPIVAIAVLFLTWGAKDLPGVVVFVVAMILAAAVLVAVHHAEVVAHRIGEPFGSLLLAVAVTVIEVGLIVTLMASGGDQAASLARDTVFAAVMITMNGIAGLSLLVGAYRFGLAQFNAEGSGAMVATVSTLATVCLVLPTFTTSARGPEFSTSQLVFAGVVSVLLYAMFVFTQTVGHLEFFVPAEELDPDHEPHAETPSRRTAFASLWLLLLSLVAVVGLAKVESPAIEDAVEAAGFPQSSVGVAIALLVLLPETIAAVRNALRDRIQISLNLAYGSAMASIGLTIPVIGIASIWLDGPLVLGLGGTQVVLLALTALVSTLTIVPGRATRLQGAVHLVLLATFVFLAMNP